MSKENKIYGIRAVIEAVEADQAINKVYLQKGLGGDLYQELEALLRKKGISTSYVPVERLNRFTQNNHQGAVADIAPVDFHHFETLMEQVLSDESKKPLFLLLDQVSDVRNFGAIIRTAECCGVSGIIIPRSGSAPLNQDTVKTSAGGVFNVPIAKVNHLKDALFYMQSSGVHVVAATEKAEKSIYESQMSEACAIVMGAEDKGITPSILKMVDESVKLPLLGEIGSLNVSVACGVFLYEAVRQRGLY
ncbi:MAG: 23S rRNA (guanosine(2251)-2'-O)-methyltransferase RlmB [Bacteroidota bacterium]